MLALMKELLGMDSDNTTKDAVFTHFLEQARLSACGYCNMETLSEMYDGTICSLAVYLYQNRDSIGYLSQKQGERSVTFDEELIPRHIRAVLPLPRVRVVGDV